MPKKQHKRIMRALEAAIEANALASRTATSATEAHSFARAADELLQTLLLMTTNYGSA